MDLCDVFASGMDMPFAPLSARIVCWNNEMKIENEEPPLESRIVTAGFLMVFDGASMIFGFSNAICQELVISGWNVADGYLPPTVPPSQ